MTIRLYSLRFLTATVIVLVCLPLDPTSAAALARIGSQGVNQGNTLATRAPSESASNRPVISTPLNREKFLVTTGSQANRVSSLQSLKPIDVILSQNGDSPPTVGGLNVILSKPQPMSPTEAPAIMTTSQIRPAPTKIFGDQIPIFHQVSLSTAATARPNLLNAPQDGVHMSKSTASPALPNSNNPPFLSHSGGNEPIQYVMPISNLPPTKENDLVDKNIGPQFDRPSEDLLKWLMMVQPMAVPIPPGSSFSIDAMEESPKEYDVESYDDAISDEDYANVTEEPTEEELETITETPLTENELEEEEAIVTTARPTVASSPEVTTRAATTQAAKPTRFFFTDPVRDRIKSRPSTVSPSAMMNKENEKDDSKLINRDNVGDKDTYSANKHASNVNSGVKVPQLSEEMLRPLNWQMGLQRPRPPPSPFVDFQMGNVKSYLTTRAPSRPASIASTRSPLHPFVRPVTVKPASTSSTQALTSSTTSVKATTSPARRRTSSKPTLTSTTSTTTMAPVTRKTSNKYSLPARSKAHSNSNSDANRLQTKSINVVKSDNKIGNAQGNAAKTKEPVGPPKSNQRTSSTTAQPDYDDDYNYYDAAAEEEGNFDDEEELLVKQTVTEEPVQSRSRPTPRIRTSTTFAVGPSRGTSSSPNRSHLYQKPTNKPMYMGNYLDYMNPNQIVTISSMGSSDSSSSEEDIDDELFAPVVSTVAPFRPPRPTRPVGPVGPVKPVEPTVPSGPVGPPYFNVPSSGPTTIINRPSGSNSFQMGSTTSDQFITPSPVSPPFLVTTTPSSHMAGPSKPSIAASFENQMGNVNGNFGSGSLQSPFLSPLPPDQFNFNSRPPAKPSGSVPNQMGSANGILQVVTASPVRPTFPSTQQPQPLDLFDLLHSQNAPGARPDFQMGNVFIQPPVTSQPSVLFTSFAIPPFMVPGYYQMGGYYHYPTTTTTAMTTSTTTATTTTASPIVTTNPPCVSTTTPGTSTGPTNSAMMASMNSSPMPPGPGLGLFPPFSTTTTSTAAPTAASTSASLTDAPATTDGSTSPTTSVSTITPARPAASFFSFSSSSSSSGSGSSSSSGSTSAFGVGSDVSATSGIGHFGFLLFFFFIGLPIVFGLLSLLELPDIVMGILIAGVVPISLFLILGVTGALTSKRSFSSKTSKKRHRWRDWRFMMSSEELRRLEQDVLAMLESYPYREEGASR